MRVDERKGEAGSSDQMEGQVFIVEGIAEITPWKFSVQLRGGLIIESAEKPRVDDGGRGSWALRDTKGGC